MKMLLLRTAPRKVQPHLSSHACSFLVAASIVFFCLSVAAKEAPKPEAAPNAVKQGPIKQTQSKRKLSEKEQRAIRLLQAAEAESGDLEPGMRAHVLWQIASGYVLLNPSHADALFKKSLEATLAIDCAEMEANDRGAPPGCQLKEALQRRLLGDMLFGSKEERTTAEEFLPRASPGVRDELTRELAIRYIREKKFDRAMSLIEEIGRTGDFPYAVCEELIAALPTERSSEKMQVFALALNSFRQAPPDAFHHITYFTYLVTRVWDSVPRPLLTEAVDDLLQRSKDLESEGNNKRAVTVTTTKGAAAFGSLYQYELFELLPMIREMDPERAKALLNDAADVRANLQKFPDGIQWTSKDTGKGPRDEGARFMSMSSVAVGSPSTGETAKYAAEQQAHAEQLARMRMITEQAATDPETALAAALTLPQWTQQGFNSPRARTLLRVASAAAKTKPAVAKKALENFANEITGANSKEQMWFMHKGDMLASAAEIYVRLDENDLALKMVQESEKAAEELYSRDTESIDPNLAIKALWPSTMIWRKAIAAAAKVSPDAAEEIIQGISDPEIKTQEKITFARALLGDDSPDFDFMDQRKDGIKNAFF
jgi:hypothetical protein